VPRVFGPVVLRVAAAKLLPDLRVGRPPEAREVVGHLHGAVVGASKLDHERDASAGEARRPSRAPKSSWMRAATAVADRGVADARASSARQAITRQARRARARSAVGASVDRASRRARPCRANSARLVHPTASAASASTGERHGIVGPSELRHRARQEARACEQLLLRLTEEGLRIGAHHPPPEPRRPAPVDGRARDLGGTRSWYAFCTPLDDRPTCRIGTSCTGAVGEEPSSHSPRWRSPAPCSRCRVVSIVGADDARASDAPRRVSPAPSTGAARLWRRWCAPIRRPSS